MKFKSIGELLARLPKDLQIKCMEAIEQETARVASGDLTEEEREFQRRAMNLALAAQDYKMNLILKILRKETEK